MRMAVHRHYDPTNDLVFKFVFGRAYWAYLQRESAILDYNNDFIDAKEAAIEEGKAEGLAAGRAAGRAEGRAEGKAKAEAELTRMFVCNLLQNGNMELEEIAKLANTTVENVARIEKESRLSK